MNGQIFECFGPDIRKVKREEIEPLLKYNLLIRFFLPFCPVGLRLIFLADGGNKKGYSFGDLYKLIKNHLAEQPLEQALDALLDTGLFSAKWGRRGNCWEILYSNKIGAMLAPYKGYLMEEVLSPIRWLQFLELLLWGPNEDPFRFFVILDEAKAKAKAKAAMRGDITVLSQMRGVQYSSLWETLKSISNGRIYDSNIKFYHKQKKVTIYRLDEWVREKKTELERRINRRNIKIIQCKLRFLLEPEKEPEKQNSRYDFTIKRFFMVPIVNFQYLGDEEEYSSLMNISCELGRDLIKKFNILV